MRFEEIQERVRIIDQTTEDFFEADREINEKVDRLLAETPVDVPFVRQLLLSHTSQAESLADECETIAAAINELPRAEDEGTWDKHIAAANCAQIAKNLREIAAGYTETLAVLGLQAER